MKELSIEDKAKRYDELLLKLQKAKVDNNVCDERYCCVIDDIVPELAKSEDEKIRKELIAFLKENHETGRAEKTWSLSGIERYIAWLEKHGEQVSAIRWYDASFIPQEMKELLVEWNSSDATWHDVAFYHADTKTFWNYERKLKNVIRWCYVEDLFWEQSNVKETGISQHDKKTWVENENSLTDKPQGKSALEAISEEKVDNTNKAKTKFNKVKTKFQRIIAEQEFGLHSYSPRIRNILMPNGVDPDKIIADMTAEQFYKLLLIFNHNENIK